jgi:hypothetical protein
MNEPKTMVNPIPPEIGPPARFDAPELADDIVAQPLVSPDFTNPQPANPNVVFRWIEFKARDGFRFQQCLAQGYAVAKITDIKDGERFRAYNRENGTKFINGDVILMKIDRGRYLGALKDRYMKTQAMTDPAVANAITSASASHEMRSAAGRVNAGKMTAFSPGAADLKDIGVDISKIPGLGGTPGVDKATGVDVRNNKP